METDPLLFRVDPGISGKRFEPVLVQSRWPSRVLLAYASDQFGYGTPEAIDLTREAWRATGPEVLAHPMHLHNLHLQYARNLHEVMSLMTGPGGYETWQHGVGPDKLGRGLYMGCVIEYEEQALSESMYRIHHGIGGVWAAGPNAFVRHVANITDQSDNLIQRVSIMCRIAGVAPTGLYKPDRSKLVMPDIAPDFTEEHDLKGKNYVFHWATAAEDPNLRHVDEDDPRGHGPNAISIVVHAALRHYVGHDVSKLKRLSVPSIPAPFYHKDTVEVRLWKNGNTVLGRLVRKIEPTAEKPDVTEEIVLDQIEMEFDLAA